MITELTKPFYHIFTMPPKQWHPILIHFPVVFLTIEAFPVVLYMVKKKPIYEKHARIFLKISFWSLFIIMAAGFHDCGLSLGRGNKFILGIQDRWENAFNFQSSVTVHFWLALLTFSIVLTRFLWQSRNPNILQDRRAYLYCFVTAIGIWVLIVTGYAGGMISHR